MINRIRSLGGRVVHPITLPKYNELKYKGTDLVMITTREILLEKKSLEFLSLDSGAQVRPAIEKYLQSLVKTKVRTLQDIVDFNSAHPDLELPKGQDSVKPSIHLSNS